MARKLGWIGSTLATALLAACSSTTQEPVDETTAFEETSFEGDAEYHAVNAQHYYQAGDYHRALDQFVKVRAQSPDSWSAALGEGYSRYFIGRNHAALGNLDTGRKELDAAEEVLTELWDGEIENDARAPDSWRWRAAMGLALVERAQGSLDKVLIDRLDGIMPNLAGTSRERALAEQKRLRIHRQETYEASLTKFERLARMNNAPPDAFQNLADLLYLTDRDAAAEDVYLAYIEMARRSVADWKRIRAEIPEKIESKNEAKLEIRSASVKLASAQEKAFDSLIRLAAIKYAKNDAEECRLALDYLVEAEEVAPERYEVNVPIAECHAKLGEREKALDRIDRFLAYSDDSDTDARRAFRLRKRIERITPAAGQ